MSRVYEGMFLIDNDTVRAGWKDAKQTVIDLIHKHGGKVHSARRWGERKLAYPIRHKRRATYLLCYYEIPGNQIPGLVLELDISETILRYLILAKEQVPAAELELAAAEGAEGYVHPEPPSDDAVLESDVIFGQKKRSEDDVLEGEEIDYDLMADYAPSAPLASGGVKRD